MRKSSADDEPILFTNNGNIYSGQKPAGEHGRRAPYPAHANDYQFLTFFHNFSLRFKANLIKGSSTLKLSR